MLINMIYLNRPYTQLHFCHVIKRLYFCNPKSCIYILLSQLMYAVNSKLYMCPEQSE